MGVIPAKAGIQYNINFGISQYFPIAGLKIIKYDTISKY